MQVHATVYLGEPLVSRLNTLLGNTQQLASHPEWGNISERGRELRARKTREQDNYRLYNHCTKERSAME